MKQIRYIMFGLLSIVASYASASPLHALQTLEALAIHPSDTPEPGACDWAKVRSACTNSTDTFNFQGCTLAHGKTVTGSLDEAFLGNGADKCTLPLLDGESVTHMSKGLMLEFSTRESVAFDTAGATAYDGTMIPATGIVSARAGDITSIGIGGAHAVFKDAEGKVTEELFALSTAPVMVSGKYGDGTLTVAQGGVRAFHQLEKYTSNYTLESLAWKDKTCCHPVDGKITEVMSGTRTGTRVLAFTAKCGSASVTDTDGSVKPVDLPACQ